MCGDTITRGSLHKGESTGSGSVANTSSAAPRNQPWSSASGSAVSSTTEPRPAFKSTAPRQRDSTSREIRPRDAGVSGTATTIQSASPTRFAISLAACTALNAALSAVPLTVPLRDTPVTCTPNACSACAMARPMSPVPTTRARVPATRAMSRGAQRRSRCASANSRTCSCIAKMRDTAHSAIMGPNDSGLRVSRMDGSRSDDIHESTPAPVH